MHIGFVCNEYPPGTHGGIGTFTQTLGRALVRRGHRVTVLGLYPSARRGEEDDQGVRVIRLATARMPLARLLIHRRRTHRAWETIHAQHPLDVIEGPENALFFVPGALPTKKIIRMNGGHHFFIQMAGQPPRRVSGWVEKASFGKADALCAVSRFVAETTRDYLKLGPVPIEILPNPVDTDQFTPNPAIPVEDGLIVFAGTLVEKKGIRQLVQAMPQIVDAVPHARLEVFGRDYPDPATGGSTLAILRDLIPSALADRIVFKGPAAHSALPGEYARAQVCVFPSHMEAQGIVIIEGMAIGKPVVGPLTGPGPELIEDGVSGLLCDPHDPASIAAAVIRLLKNPALRDSVGRRARERAIELFSLDALVARNEAFYQRVLMES